MSEDPSANLDRLLAGLASLNPLVRQLSASILVKRGTRGDSVKNALLRAYQAEEDPSVKEEFLIALSSLGFHVSPSDTGLARTEQRHSPEQDRNFALAMAFVQEQLGQGRTKQQVVALLVFKGISKVAAGPLVDSAVSLLSTSPAMATVLRRSLRRERGSRRMSHGIALLVVGGLITAGTYLVAPGGSYVVCSGALALGALYAVLGFVESLTG